MGVKRRVRVSVEVMVDAADFRRMEQLEYGDTIVEGVRSRVLEQISRMDSIEEVSLDDLRV